MYLLSTRSVPALTCFSLFQYDIEKNEMKNGQNA